MWHIYSHHVPYIWSTCIINGTLSYFDRNALYSRYSTNDWEHSNRANFGLSDRERSLAERLRADAWQAIKATDTKTRNRQHSNTRRLGKHFT